jgi:cytoskeletal protein CcmA (bactofilin family)
MWKRDEAVRPAVSPSTSTPPSNTQVTTGTPGTFGQNTEKDIVNIGKSVVIKGELNGSEDLTVEGKVEGTIQLREHVLTIGPNGRIKAEVFAKSVIVLGEVIGNVSASEKVDIRDNGSIDGDIISPRVAIAEGAHFRGSVDMQRKGGPAATAGAATAGAATPSPLAPKPNVAPEAAKSVPSTPSAGGQRAGA